MKRALLVGIDNYDHFSALRGCVNDVSALMPLLARHDDATLNFDCEVRASDSSYVSRDVLSADLDALLAPGADVALLYFAGHGAQQNHDVSLVVANGTTLTPGIPLSEILAKVQNSQVPEILIILDCCFSGASGVPQLGSAVAALRTGLSILTASRGDQTSAETRSGRGLFSTYLGGGLEGGAADVLGRVTLAGLYAYLTESFGPWQQRPTLKANVDRLHDLRQCEPAVPLADIRLLPKIFPGAGIDLALDPSYEPTAEPRDPDHEQVFSALQRCRSAKLVEPVDADHLYFAAMEYKACRLTPLGLHYRDMAMRGRL